MIPASTASKERDFRSGAATPEASSAGRRPLERMGCMSAQSPSDLRVRLLRDFIVLAFVQASAAFVLLFVILRLAAPWLVSLHDTPALWLAGLLLLACPLILFQAAYMLWNSWSRLRLRLGRTALVSP